MTDVSVHPNGSVECWPKSQVNASRIVITRHHDASGLTHWVRIECPDVDFAVTVFGKPDIDVDCPAFGDSVVEGIGDSVVEGK